MPLWKICLLASEVGFSGRRTREVWLRTLADPYAVIDRPGQTPRQKDVRSGELVAHQVGAPVPQSDVDVPQLVSEVFARPLRASRHYATMTRLVPG